MKIPVGKYISDGRRGKGKGAREWGPLCTNMSERYLSLLHLKGHLRSITSIFFCV